MPANELAKKWRAEHGYLDRGGIIVICDGVVSGWMNELRDPSHWVPGCIAVDEAGNQWIAVGGNRERGSRQWEPVSA